MSHLRLRPRDAPHRPRPDRGGRPRPAPPARPGRLPLQPGHDRRRRRRWSTSPAATRPPSRRRRGDRRARRRARRRRRAASTPACSTATSSWRPSDWADAECVPPHDLTDKAVVWPTGPAAARLQALMDASRAVVSRLAARRQPGVAVGPGLASRSCRRSARPTGSRPASSRPSTSCGGSACSPACDVGGGAGRHRLVRHQLRGQARRRASPAWPRAPTCSSSTSRPPTRPATPATWRRRCGRSRTGTPHPRRPRRGLDATWGPGGCCSCPTTPRPVALKTHTTDPVPYLLVDSATDGPGGIYTEPATAACDPVPGHQLMSAPRRTSVVEGTGR